ncbi:uncharacterized protein [Coffea arabica]|uniref:Ribosomal L1 domain-containing protein 1-like n=1 Tax=Coffea arabica TaxID=13443 RepID=A0A6P6V9H7_COFAR|nr:ribosomal L1 domain-containing protein 1-like [Coffea arabica]
MYMSMVSTSPPSPEDRISQATVTKAVKALIKWRKFHPITTQNKPAAGEEEKQEFLGDEDGNEEEDFIYLLLTLKKIPPKDSSKIPHKISLPNPLHSLADGNVSLCLIIDDRPIKSPYRITAEFAQKKVKSEDIPIDKVVKLSKLKSDCKTLEGRRKLYQSYDMLFADKRVVSLLPGVLGKQFYKKKRKIPVPLDLRSRDNWKEQIERAVNSALLCFGSGSCSVVKVGKCGGMGSHEIVENVFAAVKGISEVVPKKWDGIRALHLKLSDSLALPVYDGNLGSLNAEDRVEEGDLEKNGILELKKMRQGREGALKR